LSVLIEGQWCTDGGGYTIKLGKIFIGKIRQRGGDGIYAQCWTVTLNGEFIGEFGVDPDYARGLVERLICDELEKIVPAYKVIKHRAPPSKCFWGQDHGSYWHNWKEDRAVEGWKFVQATPRQMRAALKKSS